MMPTRPGATPPAGDRLLTVGVAALLCGLSLVAVGLGSAERTLTMAAPVALEGAASRSAEASASTTISTMAQGFALIPAPRRPRGRFVGDGMGWAIPPTRGDRGAYLLRTAAAPWFLARQSPGDTRWAEAPVWRWEPIRQAQMFEE